MCSKLHYALDTAHLRINWKTHLSARKMHQISFTVASTDVLVSDSQSTRPWIGPGA